MKLSEFNTLVEENVINVRMAHRAGFRRVVITRGCVVTFVDFFRNTICYRLLLKVAKIGSRGMYLGILDHLHKRPGSAQDVRSRIKPLIKSTSGVKSLVRRRASAF